MTLKYLLFCHCSLGKSLWFLKSHGTCNHLTGGALNCPQKRFSEQFNKANSSRTQGPGSIQPSILKKLKYETAKLLISEISLESREIQSGKCDAIKKKKSVKSRAEKLLTSKIDFCTRQIGTDHRK